MEELMQDKTKDKNNNIDLNNNGIPDWAEERQDDWENHPTEPGSPFSFAYENEQQVADLVPDYKNYKWYKQPEEGYYYSYGEKLENAIESGEITPDELPENSAIQKEAEQLTDSNPNNDEVNNEAIKEISQEDFNKMSLDEIEKADAEAMKGEGDYLTVAKDLGFEDDEFLGYIEQAGYNPEEVENLTEEQKEEIRNEPDKESKFSKLKEFLSFGGDVNTELPIEETSIEEKGNTPITSGVRTAGFSFLGNSGGSASPASIRSTNVDINSDNGSNSNNTASGNTPEVAEMDGNIASTNGANKVEHLDDAMDSLSFKDTEHEENIKTDEQADLPSGETWTENNDHWELPDIKEMMTKQGGGTYLPFKFTVEDGELYISQIGTGRKLPFDDFLKAEPLAGKQIIEVINGDK